MAPSSIEQLLDQLIDVLDRMLKTYRALTEEVRLESEAIRSSDTQRLEAAVLQKEALLRDAYQLENHRLQIISAIAFELRLKPTETTLESLILHFEPTETVRAKRLRSLKTALRFMIDRARSLNQENEGIVLGTLSHIEQMKRNILGESEPTAASYGQKGQRTYGRPEGPRLVAEEA